jgi:Protein of unknown function (DUF4239)
MTDFLFDLPLVVSGLLIVGSLGLFAVTGMALVRSHALPRLRIQAADAGFTGTMVQAVMVFYGLAVALIAVNVFETHSDVSKTVSQEAAALAALYRDVSSYPEPVRPLLQDELRDYAQYVIHEAWPAHQRGQVVRGGVEMLNRFQETLIGFEPITEGQILLHAEALQAYNRLVEVRSLRLDAVHTGLPGMMWVVIVAGALIGLVSSFFFHVEDGRLHGILVKLLAVFMGLIIFMIFALDHPFRGELGVTAESYELVYDQVMKPAP